MMQNTGYTTSPVNIIITPEKVVVKIGGVQLKMSPFSTRDLIWVNHKFEHYFLNQFYFIFVFK